MGAEEFMLNGCCMIKPHKSYSIKHEQLISLMEQYAKHKAIQELNKLDDRIDNECCNDSDWIYTGMIDEQVDKLIKNNNG
jgi:hypothetical protein